MTRRLALLGLTATLIAPAPPATAPGAEWSPEYRESLRRTVELRRRRRADRAGPPVGGIVPWPMPPALVVRQTPEVHGEIRDLLRSLRGRRAPPARPRRSSAFRPGPGGSAPTGHGPGVSGVQDSTAR